MKKHSKRFIERLCFHFLLLCLALYSPGNFAQQPEVAGRVVAVNGQVSAIDGGGSSRVLARRSEIFVGDTIVTEAAAFAQIRMTDSAIVSLAELTQFEIVSDDCPWTPPPVVAE